MVATEIKNDALERKRKKKRIVEEHTEKEYYVCGKKTNKNVYELQMLYETTQAKTTKVLPEFLERIRYLIVKGICKTTYSKSVDQQGELFNHTVETVLNKIVPKRDPITKKLVAKYDSTKTNLGAYILNACYWSVVAFQNNESWCESLLSCSDYLEDCDEASEQPILAELGQLKFIKNFEQSNSYVPFIQSLLEGDKYEDN